MLISKILAWITVLFAALSAFKFIARKSGNKKLNQWFHKTHIPFGLCFIIAGILHGLLAGNFPGATLSDLVIAPELFTLNWGTAALLAGILLGITYLLRKKLKKLWMPLHRILTCILIVLITLHVIDMGIHVFDGLTTGTTSSAGTITTQAVTETTAETTSETAAQTSASKGSSETTATTAETTTYAVDPTVASSLFSGAVLKDGTYTGSGTGYSGTTTVEVTVSGGKVTAINVVSENDSPQYFSRAESLIDTIISGQSLQVDAVSGATFSSKGLMDAITDALTGAVSSGTLSTTSYDTSNIPQHGH